MAPLKQDLEYVGLASLKVSPFNARFGLEEEDSQDWEEFKADIKEHGLLQPLLVTKDDGEAGGFNVEDGARRLRALEEIYSNREGVLVAGAPAVPCEVVDVKEALDRAVLSFTSTDKRRNLTPAQAAAQIGKLKKMGLNQADIAKRLHRTPAWVSMVKEGKQWTEHKKTSSSQVPQARTFEDTECPACGNVLGISLQDGKIVLEAKGKEDAEEEKAAKKKRGGGKK